jgi:gliding motility-associated-like protein
MRRKHLNIILLLFIFCSYNGYSQTDCTVPLPPVLSTVSVQPETGKTEFNWILSESTDIAAYIIYSYKDGDAKAIDTVWNPAATSWVITNTAPKYSSVSYVVAAHRLSAIPGNPGCTSRLSNVLSTIFCQAEIDTCRKKISISWNSYPSIPKEVFGYSVMLSVNGGTFSEAQSSGADINSFTLDNFETDADYCFYITADLGGNNSSKSNKACVRTKMQRPPAWINADYATINPDRKILLSFSADPMSDVTDFRLERKIGATGSFQAIADLTSGNGSVLYTDQLADINTVNYYRLSAMNNCNIPITVSNISSNMVLQMERSGNELNFSWNAYREWIGGVSSYSMEVNTGSGFVEKAVISPGDTSFTLGYDEIMYDVSGGEICFYILASEDSNPNVMSGHSNSSGICISPTEVITVPNIFTPNNDLKNDFFKPVLSFTPSAYHLIVSDQKGTVIFETRDNNESWDGSENGKAEPDGICLWFLKVTTPSGKIISKTGTVAIIRNP